MITKDAMGVLVQHDAPRSAVMVYVCLAGHYNRFRMAAWPSRSLIREETGFSEGSVQTALTWLEQHGLIRRRPWHAGRSKQVVTWDLPHLTEAVLRDQNSGKSALAMKEQWVEAITDVQPKARERINEDHLAKVLRDIGDRHGYDIAYYAVDYWIVSQGTDFPKHLANGVMPDPVATFHAWLNFEGIEMIEERLEARARKYHTL